MFQVPVDERNTYDLYGALDPIPFTSLFILQFPRCSRTTPVALPSITVKPTDTAQKNPHTPSYIHLHLVFFCFNLAALVQSSSLSSFLNSTLRRRRFMSQSFVTLVLLLVNLSFLCSA